MADIVTWPEDLPSPLMASYVHTLDAGVIRSAQSGFARERSRYRHAVTQIKLSWALMPEEVVSFKQFYFQDVRCGAIFFQIELKLDTDFELVTVRFLSDNVPEIRPIDSSQNWMVDATLEVLTAHVGVAVDDRITEEGEQRITESGEVRQV